ncbi:MAG: hydrogen gas-evolving membrane-bound hydrogenase subunit E [Candidatus Omnitrophota bacterium]|jgi:multisubunit Na+/H+ antiporter MnhB subunit
MIEIHLILFFMIAAAIIAVEAKDLLSSVVAIGGVGIGLSMAFLILKAPDLAIMQLVVEILSLVILVRATMRHDLPFSMSGRWVFNTFSTLIFIVVFLISAYAVLKNIPQLGSGLSRTSDIYMREAVAKTGIKNVVAAITLNYRLLDTLGEVAAIFASVVGVMAIARRVVRK